MRLHASSFMLRGTRALLPMLSVWSYLVYFCLGLSIPLLAHILPVCWPVIVCLASLMAPAIAV